MKKKIGTMVGTAVDMVTQYTHTHAHDGNIYKLGNVCILIGLFSICRFIFM